MKNTPTLRFRGFIDEWEEYELDNIIEISKNKYNPLKCEETYKCIELENISQGTGQLLGFFSSKDQQSVKNKFNTGQVLFGKLRPYLRKYWLAEFEGVCSSEIWVLEGKKVLNQFLYYIIQTNQFNFISNISSGSKMPRADWSYMSEYPFYIPSLEEQEKIASFFSLIDKKIELQTKKVEELKNYKKGIMQKIFSQELRFKDENGNNYPEWEEKELRKYLIPRVQKQVPSKEAPLMAFTSKGGIESKGEKYDRSFLVKDETKKYKRTEFNDFIYSSNNLDVGSMGLNKYGTAVISDVYEIFQIEKSVLPDIVNVILHKPDVLNKVLKYRQGALYGQYRIHADDFLSVNVKIPCYKEQEKIALFLESIDKSINMHTKKRDLLIDYKKGLLQQMFI